MGKEYELAQNQKEYELNHYMKEIKKLKEIIKQTNHEKDEHLNNLQREIAANKLELETQQKIVSKLNDEMQKDEQLLNDLKTKIHCEQMEKNKIEFEKNEILLSSEAYRMKINKTIKKLQRKISTKTKEFEFKVSELKQFKNKNQNETEAKMRALDEKYQKDLDLLQYELKNKKLLAEEQIITDYVVYNNEIAGEAETEPE